MLIGYARVSTHDQTLALQQDALKQAGCERLFTDTASGAKADRPGLEEALSHIRSGDTLVVWKLDRLGRSLPHLIETITRLQERGIGFKSLTEQIDTTTSGGKLIFHVFAALAEFERDVIRERTQAGLDRSSSPRQTWWAPQGRRAQRRQEGGDGPGSLQRQEELDRRHLQDAAGLALDALPLHHREPLATIDNCQPTPGPARFRSKNPATFRSK